MRQRDLGVMSSELVALSWQLRKACHRPMDHDCRTDVHRAVSILRGLIREDDARHAHEREIAA